MTSDTLLYLVASVYLAVNLFAFSIMLFDKIRSTRTGAERVSEGTLFFLATAFAAIGVYIGMFTFRHKTRKWYFLIGIPLLIVQNASLAYLIFLYFSGVFSGYLHI